MLGKGKGKGKWKVEGDFALQSQPNNRYSTNCTTSLIHSSWPGYHINTGVAELQLLLIAQTKHVLCDGVPNGRPWMPRVYIKVRSCESRCLVIDDFKEWRHLDNLSPSLRPSWPAGAQKGAAMTRRLSLLGTGSTATSNQRPEVARQRQSTLLWTKETTKSGIDENGTSFISLAIHRLRHRNHWTMPRPFHSLERTSFRCSLTTG